MVSSSLQDPPVSVTYKQPIRDCPPYFVFVHNPALQVTVPALVTVVFLDDSVDGHVFQTGVLRQKLTVAAFAHTRSTSDDDIRLLSCHGL